MADQNDSIAMLRAVRARLVDDRRRRAQALAGASGAPNGLALDSFTHIQEAIELLDRAIEDERRMAPERASSVPLAV
jgi:hypothetical protein